LALFTRQQILLFAAGTVSSRSLLKHVSTSEGRFCACLYI